MIAFDRPADAPPGKKPDRNVLGLPLAPCSSQPLTGFFRDGCCRTGPDDVGQHTVCAVMTRDFLKFTVAVGNDLVTPRPEWDFPGLQEGDHWCLCAARWMEAAQAGQHARKRNRAPPRALVHEGGELLRAQLAVELRPELSGRALGALQAENIFQRHRARIVTFHHLRV